MTDLPPCPICGAGVTEEREKRLAPRMDGKQPALICVDIIHWCEPMPGVANTSATIRITGRDHESARAAWSRRAPWR